MPTLRALPLAALAAALLAAAAGGAPGEVEESRRLYGEALAARAAGDAAGYVAGMEKAAALRPHHPALQAQLAAALAANGRAEEAIAALERVAAMGTAVAVADDPAFASLRESPRFRAVVQALARNEAPIGEATVAFALPERGAIPEGLAHDPASGRFFVGGVRAGTVWVVDAAGAARVFAQVPWGAFGMTVDRERRVLWVTSSALPQHAGFREGDRGRAGLVKLDLGTGRQIAAYPAPAEGEHVFGDVTVAADGAVYVSDSASPAVYRLGESRLERWAEAPGLVSPQGLAASPDGKRLYLADYSTGLWAIDVATREARLLPLPATATLLGLDGVYTVDADTLVGVQNGTTPPRIVTIELAPDGATVRGVDTLLANHPAVDDPTLGVVAGDAFHFIATAQWRLFADDGTLTDPTALRDLTVLRVRLPR